MKPIALQLYSVREFTEKDFIGTLKKVAEIGFAGVEPAGLYGHSPQEIRKVLDDLGLQVCSDHVGRDTIDDVNQVVETAQALGHTNVVLPNTGREHWPAPKKIKAVAQKYQALAETLGSHGLRMSYHNHAQEMQVFDGRYGLDIFLEEAPSIYPQIDLHWAANFGAVDVPALVERYKDRLPTVHLKDGTFDKGQPNVVLGQGKMDLPACIAAADENVLEWLIIEFDDYAGDIMEAVAASYRYLVSAGLGEGNK